MGNDKIVKSVGIFEQLSSNKIAIADGMRQLLCYIDGGLEERERGAGAYVDGWGEWP